MDTIELLVATMHQTDLRKYYDMNIKTDAIIANQAEEYKYQEEILENHNIRMITTISKGVGKNRNQAILHSNADICLLSDDDMLYDNNYPNIVKQAFSELPKADIIIFNIETIGKDVKRRKNHSISRINIFNFQNYGAARIAFRRNVIIKKNIWFSLLFGGGCLYSSGEDTLFLREALRYRLKIYTYPETIGTVNQEKSSWFTGYHEKFFFDKGALLSAVFPFLKYFLGLIYFPWRFRNHTKLAWNKRCYCLLAGIRAFSKGLSYDEWKAILILK